MLHHHPQYYQLGTYHLGMIMPGRSYSSTAYRFGMNGQEKDDEIAGNGNIYSALYWEYDSRSIRRWNLDPKPDVSISNYACFGGNPVLLSDPNGDSIFFCGMNKDFIDAWRIFLNTKDGIAMIKLYYANPTEHIYFTMDDKLSYNDKKTGEEKEYANAVTFPSDITPSFLDSKNILNKDKVGRKVTPIGLKYINGKQLKDPTKNKLIIISLSIKSFASRNKYKNAKTIGHEFLSHVLGGLINEKPSNERWIKEHNNSKAPEERLQKELDGLKNQDKL